MTGAERAESQIVPLHQWSHTGYRVRFVVPWVNEIAPPPAIGGWLGPRLQPDPAVDAWDRLGLPWGVGVVPVVDRPQAEWLVVDVLPVEVTVESHGVYRIKRGRVSDRGDLTQVMQATRSGRLAWLKSQNPATLTAYGLACDPNFRTLKASVSAGQVPVLAGHSGAAVYVGGVGNYGGATAVGQHNVGVAVNGDSFVDVCGRQSVAAASGGGNAYAEGAHAAAATAGGNSHATTVGDNSGALATSLRSFASVRGTSGLAATTAVMGRSTLSGSFGVAAATGYHSHVVCPDGAYNIAVASGSASSVKVDGECGVGLIRGEGSTIDMASSGLAVCLGPKGIWTVHPDVTLVQMWSDDRGHTRTAMLRSNDYDVTDGETLLVITGRIFRGAADSRELPGQQPGDHYARPGLALMRVNRREDAAV